jgi:uncharacterized membrane protein YkvA (DUF1232 family)
MAQIDAPKFLSTVRRVARHVPFARQAVAMYYATLDKQTPAWVKGMVAGALAYFLLPIDAIADILPFIGFTDDAGVMFATYQAVSKHVTEDHDLKAREFLEGLKSKAE